MKNVDNLLNFFYDYEKVNKIQKISSPSPSSPSLFEMLKEIKMSSQPEPVLTEHQAKLEVF